MNIPWLCICSVSALACDFLHSFPCKLVALEKAYVCPKLF
jgi:hypothetical protein